MKGFRLAYKSAQQWILSLSILCWTVAWKGTSNGDTIVVEYPSLEVCWGKKMLSFRNWDEGGGGLTMIAGFLISHRWLREKLEVYWNLLQYHFVIVNIFMHPPNRGCNITTRVLCPVLLQLPREYARAVLVPQRFNIYLPWELTARIYMLLNWQAIQSLYADYAILPSFSAVGS